MKFNKKFNAFTMAEVLITLGVIGVISAMTLPSVIKNYQKEVTVNKLKKVYTILNQAIKLSEAENGEYKDWQAIEDIGVTKYYETYWKPYLKSVKLCKSPQDCGYNSLKPFYNLNGTKWSYDLTGGSTRIVLILGDGTLLQIMAKTGYTPAARYMTVDLNGPKKPNKLGKDVFMFIRNTNGQILPLGHPNGECNASGEFCASKIMRDGWKIKDDYPW